MVWTVLFYICELGGSWLIGWPPLMNPTKAWVVHRNPILFQVRLGFQGKYPRKLTPWSKKMICWERRPTSFYYPHKNLPWPLDSENCLKHWKQTVTFISITKVTYAYVVSVGIMGRATFTKWQILLFCKQRWGLYLCLCYTQLQTC